MKSDFISSCRLPADLSPDTEEALCDFVRENFRPACCIGRASVDGDTLSVRWGQFNHTNEAMLTRMVTLYLSKDLVPISKAAAACGVDVRVISDAARRDRITWYTDPDEPNPQRSRLVSMSECRQRWRKE